MAITKSAKKAIRVSERKKVVNDRIKKTMRAEVKTVKDKVAKKESVTVQDLSSAYKAIDKAAKRGTIKKGQADRKKSRLATAAAKAA
ncbi:MAG: small subunit ribosomal protein, partial [Patescibacteria group bacterium]|nr:small subunit ribosomal protein [Patescibacteria group bacterium]